MALGAGIESLAGRTRVNLTPGHSLMDWIRLGQEKGDLSGVGSHKLKITEEELSKHNKADDMWMVIKGKVYNITPYVHFHPGGVEELMRAAGKDGTVLFEEIHSWVNVESMLSRCVVGTVSTGRVSYGNMAKLSLPTTQDMSRVPHYDWYQTPEHVKVVVYTKHPDLEDNKVVVDINNNEVIIEVYIQHQSFFVHFAPFAQLENECKVVTVKEKAEITFNKQVLDKNWTSLGKPLDKDKHLVKTSLSEQRYWSLTAVSNSQVTHDTYLICLKLPSTTRMVIPIGYHIIANCKVQGMELARSYTVIEPCLLEEKEAAIKKMTYPQTGKDLIYLMVKDYNGGAISPIITSLKPGDKLKISRYDGNFLTSRFQGITHLVMFAAGTGFTVMVRPIRHILYMKNSKVEATLLFYNKTVEDIMWKDQLDYLQYINPKFNVKYSLSLNAPEGWTGYTGRVTIDHVQQFVPVPSDKVKPLVLICGPYAFNDTVIGFVKSHGLSDEHIHVFSSTS